MNAAALLSIGLLLQALAPAHAPKITEEMIKSYLATQYDCKAEDIYIDKMEYFNFTGHEYSDVMVVASTCATGTAGPDVHSVFSWADEDQLGELEIEEVNPKLYQVLFGNRNFDLTARKDDGELIETFTDTSERVAPLVLSFRWDGKQHKFLLASAQSAPMYKTSYDCSKAQKDVDQAICYVESLAKLDVELNTAYSSLRAALSPEARKSLIQEQRNWLSERDCACAIYKGWVGCLSEKYDGRITELKKRISDAMH